MNKTTRVRYTYDGARYISKEMLAGDDTVWASVDAKNGTFVIYDSKGNVAVKGEAKNYGELKKLVKVELQNLGVNFTDEVRDTKKKRLARGEDVKASDKELAERAEIERIELSVPMGNPDDLIGYPEAIEKEQAG